MARNALMPQMQMYEAPAGPQLGNLTNPLMAGLQTYRQGIQQQFEGDRALAKERMALRGEARSDETLRLQKEKMEVERLGKLAQVVADDPDENRARATWQRILQSNQAMPTLLQRYGVDANDHRTGAKFLMAEVGAYKSPAERENERLKQDQLRAQTDMTRAHADFYRTRAGALAPQASGAAPAAADPLAGMGIDDDGNIVGGQAGAQPANPAYGPGQGETWQLQNRLFPEPMRLGGPRDDIDASMRLDEGRPQARGVQVAQATAPWKPDASLMDQAAARMFGPTGVTSPEVPGLVTDAGRNRRVDVPATREAQGQRAYDRATPEQKQRLMRLRQDQQLWSAALGPPRAGYYYGPDGRELPKTDRNFKGDKEMQAQALLNMQKIDQATKILLGVNERGAETSTVIDRAIPGYFNIGETGQALSDLKQGALGIAYALSGKTVAVAEMKNFVEAYGPQWNDTNARVKAKVERMKQFYGALIAATRGGESYDQAFAKAMAVMGVKNPDGTPAGGPAGSDAGKPKAPDLTGVPTEELIRRLQGGR